MRTAPIRLASVFVVVATTLVARPAPASWPFTTTGNLEVCHQPSGARTSLSAVSDDQSGAIVLWQDTRNAFSDIYAQRILVSGIVDPTWSAGGFPVCNATSNQSGPVSIPDGSGGAIVTWYDNRNGPDDIYAQHVLPSGVDPAWPSNGCALCTATNGQAFPAIVTDGSGGAIVAWQDGRGATTDIYAQHVLASGDVDPAWPVNGLAVCTAAGTQTTAAIAMDGAGGAIVTWQDARAAAGQDDIYAQHVLASGAVDPVWPANGRALTAPSTLMDVTPRIVSDGTGGAYVAWVIMIASQPGFFIRHLTSSGTVQSGWPSFGTGAFGFSDDPKFATVDDGSGGVIVCYKACNAGCSSFILYVTRFLASGAQQFTRNICSAAGGSQTVPRIVPDGAGNWFVAWNDARYGTNDVFVRKLTPAVAEPPANGVLLCEAAASQENAVVVADAVGGAIVAWQDLRNGGGFDVYAQRVAPFGRLGNPEAALTGVSDVPGDQGGRVRIAWSASYLDTLPTLEIGSYGIWRRVDAEAAQAAIGRGAPVASAAAGAEAARPGVFRRTVEQSDAVFWEGVGSVPARASASYSFVAPTFTDSTGVSNPLSVFMVDTHAAFVPGFLSLIHI